MAPADLAGTGRWHNQRRSDSRLADGQATRRPGRPAHSGNKRGPPGASAPSTELAGVPGLEPRLTGPEPVGLPITPYPTGSGHRGPDAPCSLDAPVQCSRSADGAAKEIGP